MRVRRAVIALLAFGLLPAQANSALSFKDLWTEATTQPGSTIKEYPDFLMVTSQDGFTLYYFTKSNHPANPGVIKRMITQKDGAWFVREEGHSFAPDAAQPAFKAWLAQFQELDRQMKEYVAQHH